MVAYDRQEGVAVDDTGFHSLGDNAVVAIVVAGILRLWAGAALGFRPVDDAFISFRYAINLGAGRGFVYNINEWVLGTTTPLWTLVLAALSHIGIPMGTGALMLSLVADIATAKRATMSGWR